MALRLFAGVTDKTSALHVVDRLFGSINGEEGQNVGLLAMHYVNASVSLDRFGNGRWEQPVFSTTGVLQWHLVRSLTNREDEVLLQSFLSSIHGIVMALGGFGRSWRRPDHRIFMPSYSKTPIGCYWQWGDPATLSPDLNVQSANDLSLLLRKARTLARQWLRGKTSSINASAQWREIIHPSRMLIWTRIASNSQDAKIVHWFHQEPLKRSDLAGRLENKDLDSRPTRIGRIWNRLLPIATGSLAIPSSTSIAGDQKVDLRIPAPGAATQRPMRRLPGRTSSAEGSARPGNDDQASFPIHQGQFLESVVLFPDRGVNGMFTSESKAFLERIKYDADANFMLLEWPD
jgi:CRISPR-associated protein Cmr6